MIQLKITVDTPDQGLVFHPWWDNLFDAARRGLFAWAKIDEFLLENYNGRIIYDDLDPEFDDLPVVSVEFETEEEATLFLLRWR